MISYENSHTKYLDGKLIDKLIPFYESQKDTTEVFCMQEVSHTESTDERVND